MTPEPLRELDLDGQCTACLATFVLAFLPSARGYLFVPTRHIELTTTGQLQHRCGGRIRLFGASHAFTLAPSQAHGAL